MMVFIGDDIELYLVCEGREPWRVEGRHERVILCPNCENIQTDPLPELDSRSAATEVHLSECPECGAIVEERYTDAFSCSACPSLIVGRDAFLDHVEAYHPPSLR